MAAQALSAALPPDLSSPCLDHAPLPMATVEGAMHIVRYANPTFCRLVDKTTVELLGKPFSTILPDADDCRALLDRVYRTGIAETHTRQSGSAELPVSSLYTMWPVMSDARIAGVMIQVSETAPLVEKTLAMNEALILGLLRQQKSTAATDSSNIELQMEITDRKQHEAEMVALSMTDPLTGVANRRLMVQALTLEVSRAERTGGKFCVCMIDIDHFKRVNDAHGHEAGDKVLVAFGDLLRRHTRPTDVVARFGGEEFVVLLSHTSLDHALATAERIRTAFAACRVEPLTDPVTASFGVAELAPRESGEAVLRRADKALYVAKHAGRNRVAAG